MMDMNTVMIAVAMPTETVEPVTLFCLPVRAAYCWSVQGPYPAPVSALYAALSASDSHLR